jgi:hypothetical protein
VALTQADDIADLVTTTQRDLGKMKWTDLAEDLQEYVALPSLLRTNRTMFGSGYGIQWNVMVGTSGAAHDAGLFDVDNVNIGDVMITGNIPWRHVNTNYAIEKREVSMNRSPARLIELVKIRRTDAMIDLAKHMETKLWSRPSVASTGDGLYGIPYWINYSATEGLTGTVPISGSETTIGNINPTTYDQWRNRSYTYVNVTKQDLIRDWREAATKCGFRPPVAVPQYGSGDRYGYYTEYDVIASLEEILEAQNQNLGNDIASKDGRTIFRSTEVKWVPQLDGRTGSPIYGINWGVFKLVFLTGEYLRETGPIQASNQHNTLQTHVDLTMNAVCYDRRKNFVLATADPDTTS